MIILFANNTSIGQTDFSVSNKVAIVSDTTASNSLGESPSILITNNKSTALRLRYLLVSADTPKGWTVSNCDNSQCYSVLKTGDSMASILPKSSGGFDVNSLAHGICSNDTVKYYFYEVGNFAQHDTVTFIVNLSCQTVSSIESAFQHAYSLQLYPNPSSDNIRISSQNLQSQVGNLNIYSITGQKVININGFNINEEIQVKSLYRGLYTIQFRSSAGDLYEAKFVKE